MKEHLQWLKKIGLTLLDFTCRSCKKKCYEALSNNMAKHFGKRKWGTCDVCWSKEQLEKYRNKLCLFCGSNKNVKRVEDEDSEYNYLCNKCTDKEIKRWERKIAWSKGAFS